MSNLHSESEDDMEVMGDQNLRNEQSERDDDYLMGCHEPFDTDLGNKYKTDQLEEEVKLLKLAKGHLEWHCMMYRKALQETEGGCDSLRKALNDFEENEHDFYSCSCCEYEDLNQTMKVLQETQQSSCNGSENTNRRENDEKNNSCPCCTTDALILEISSMQDMSKISNS